MKAPSGFTLLELMVSIAIGTIIMLILSGIFLAQGVFFDIEGAISQTQINAFQVIDTVGQYASSPMTVVANQVINGRSYVSGTNTVILELPSVDSGGAIIANTYDYIALGLDPANAARFMFDIDSATGSTRLNGKFTKALLVDTLIFRYNSISPNNATILDTFIQTSKTVRGRTIIYPLGKLYYLGTT